MPLLLLLCSLFRCADEHYQDFDAVFEQKVAEHNLASNSELMDLLFDSGLYWTNGLSIVSKSVELHGTKAWLTHRANVQKEMIRTDPDIGKETLSKDTNVERWMMEVQNSSLTVRSWRLDAGNAGTTVCLVVGSSVEVIDSEILSNMECSGFIIADSMGRGASRIVIVGSSHKSSTQNVVLPLVGRGSGQLNKNNEGFKGDDAGFRDGYVEREDIIGVGLSFDSTHFTLGTGPLFSFAAKSLSSGSDIGMVGEISTELRLSSILNVTSSFVFGEGSKTSLGVGSCVWERVVGSSISESTNHDRGTILCGTRLGFNVDCVNTSFSSCVRNSIDEIDMKHENITQEHIGVTFLEHSDLISIQFSHCTFKDMKYIPDPSNWAYKGGAAIYLYKPYYCPLNVSNCNFHNCTGTGSYPYGGAIYTYGTSSSDCDVAITLSSFTECTVEGSNYGYGGSVYLSTENSLSICDCFFEKCSTNGYYGALSIGSHSNAILTNCAFVSCSAYRRGGGLGLSGVVQIELSYLQFRNGSTEHEKYSTDVFFRFHVGRSYQLELNSILRLNFEMEVDVSMVGEAALVTATSNKTINGTMGILLKGSNVPRLVHVQFGITTEKSEKGYAAVSSGANGILPPAEDGEYELRASSLAPNYYYPNPYLIYSATADFHVFDHSGEQLKYFDSVGITLHGMNLEKWSYWMWFRNGNKYFDTVLNHINSTTLTGSFLLPTSAPYQRLEWSTEYEVKTVTWFLDDGDEVNITLLNNVTFMTPAKPPFITSLLSTQVSGKKDTITLTLEGSLLPIGTRTIKLVQDYYRPEVRTGVLTITSSTECTAVISTGWTESATQLSYGTTYLVYNKTLVTDTIAITSGLKFTVPNPPVITSFIVPTECSSNTFQIEVVGQNFPYPQTYTLALSDTLTVPITLSSETKGTGTVNAGLPSAVQFNKTYSVLSVKNGDDHVLLNVTSLKTPLGPLLKSISTSLKAPHKKEVILSLNGLRMMSGPHNLTVVEEGTTTPLIISVSINTETSGSGSEELCGGTKLKYGKTYEVKSLTSTKVHFAVAPSLKFSTDTEPPRLTLVTYTGLSDKDRKAEFSVSGRMMTIDELYTIFVNQTGTSLQTSFEVRMSSREVGGGSAVLFSQTEGEIELDYDTGYEVVGVTDSSKSSILFETTLTFETPKEPSRLVKIVSVKDEGLNSTTLTLSSRVLTVGKEYEMKVTGTPLSSSTSSSNTNHETTLTFTATSATLNTVPLTLYPFEDAIVKYGHSYSVDWMKTVDDDPIFIETETCAFETPTEPARICSCTGAVLNKDRTEVTISLEGRALGDSLGSIWVSFGDTFWKSLSMRKESETLCEADFLVTSSESVTQLKYEGDYTVCLKQDEVTTLLVDSGITVHIPVPPSFTEMKFEFTNSLGTGCIAILNGTDLVVGTEYEVRLNTSHTFSIVVKSSTRAESSEMLIGLEGALAYSAEILIETIEPADEESGVVLVPEPFTGRTPARLNVSEIIVDAKTGNNDWTCGDSSRPCSTMDIAWKIVRRLGIMSPTFSLLDITSLSSQLTVESGMSVLIQNGTNSEPSLNIPSSAAESATSALIVVSSALLNIQNIDIVVGSSKMSFVLISASSSKMILKDGLMTVKSETTGNGNEMDELCVWTTGLLDLIETEINITNNHLFNIPQGAIRMKGGIAKIESSVFRDNIPSNSSFSSARRNIACSENGTVQIGSLSAGDGFKKSSAWISSEGCSVESTEMNADAPLFIPTLSSDSTSKLDKKTKMLTLTIEGTTLFPCSLFLKVFEMKKDGTEGNSTLIPLTIDSVASFIELKIVITLPSSSLKSLDDSLEWRGRLMFGENQTTTNSFLIQQSSSGRFAQALNDNMKWWIPLVVVVSCALLALILVLVVLMQHRKKNKAEKDQKDAQQELDQTDEKMDVMMAEDGRYDSHNTANNAVPKHLHGMPTMTNHRSQSLKITDNVMSTCQDQAAVLIVGEDQFGRPKIEDGFVNSHDTLFNRLHGREKPSALNIYRTRLDVAKAVATLLSLRPNAQALRELNPHWVLFSPSNMICFKLNADAPILTPTTIAVQAGAQKETQEEKRWAAPEEENREIGIDERKATVFRLGLILWEITTGQVPFRETDVVNAQRQLKMGVVPRMDSVEPVELATLLLECLDLNPQCRPSVESVLSRLESLDEGMKEASNLLELPNHQLEPQRRSAASNQE